MRLLSLESIQKKLDKKNAELLEVRALRKKLAEREKNISADIAFLQNQKVEAIFLQVKRGIKHENLDVSSADILPLLEALRNNQQLLNDTNSVEKVRLKLTIQPPAQTKTLHLILLKIFIPALQSLKR